MSSSAIASAPVASGAHGLPADLLRWYDHHRRRLPWRAEPDETPNPYRVWLSEIMLQQTTVTAVIPYYERFVSRFPTVQALAAAPLDTVLSAWAGLGYYARARNLHACAQLCRRLGGFPVDLAGLQSLPGIGAYTAAAIGAIAFGIPAVPVDGNVERVAARLFAIDQPMPAAKPAIREAAPASVRTPPPAPGRATSRRRCSTWEQASAPRPRRVARSVHGSTACGARRMGIQASLPRKSPKKHRPVRYGVHFWLTDDLQTVLLRTRPAKGLLGGMTELPGTPWRDTPWTIDEALTEAPMPLSPASSVWRNVGQVRHGFTHFELILDVLAAHVPRIETEGFTLALDDLDDAALPSVMRKCVRMAIGER